MLVILSAVAELEQNLVREQSSAAAWGAPGWEAGTSVALDSSSVARLRSATVARLKRRAPDTSPSTVRPQNAPCHDAPRLHCRSRRIQCCNVFH